ncbi:MAG: FkbM family methyltransferase [Nitrososphaerota archaeon]
MPNTCKGILIAIKQACILNMFLKQRYIPILNLLAEGEKEILYGTALFPGSNFYVADVGAYRGYYTILSSKIVGPQGHVYSFEPEPNNFQILSKSVILNRLRNVTLFKLALSDKDVFENLYLSEYPSMHSTVIKRGIKVISVPCMRLDTLIKQRKIARLDLIKVDVEGAELKVLRGCEDLIKEFKPIFSIDVNHYERARRS